MSKADLLKIINAFPSNAIENIIISALRELFLSGEWGTADTILEVILSLDGKYNSLKSRALCFGIFMAARANNRQQALNRFEYLGKLDRSDTNICHLAEGLFHLSDLLLDNQPSLLADLWQLQICSDLPAYAQEKLAIIGLMLCKRFHKNNDLRQCAAIAKNMKKHLDSQILEPFKTKIKAYLC